MNHRRSRFLFYKSNYSFCQEEMNGKFCHNKVYIDEVRLRRLQKHPNQSNNYFGKLFVSNKIGQIFHVHCIALYCHLSYCRSIAKLSSNFSKHSTLHQTDIFRTQLLTEVDNYLDLISTRKRNKVACFNNII